MCESLGHLRDYQLKDEEFIDVTPDSLKAGMNWDKNFRYLGNQYRQHHPFTLWCDLFALSLLYLQQSNVKMFIQPCYCEIHQSSARNVR
jgi:hypothetical protein